MAKGSTKQFALLRKSCVSSAALGCALLAASTPGWTQDSEEKLTEVTVVGSRIRHDTFDSPSPVQVITREEATMAGFNSTTDLLQGTAVTGGGSQINNAYGRFVTDGGPGANSLSLRDLGATRTLVLINGRRVAPAGTRGAVGSPDLNVLPNAIVDRIEILRDGASSIYGSDAVAGVVNVVTRKNIEDINIEAQYNQPEHGGGEQARVSFVSGFGGERWDIVGSLEYYERSDLTLADRDWTRCNADGFINRTTGGSADFIDPTTGRPKCYPITATGSNGTTINTIGSSSAAGVGAPGSVGTSFDRWRPNPNVTTGVVGFEGVGGGSNNRNVRDTFEPRMLNRNLISPAKTYTGFLQGSFQLQTLGDAQLYFELLANQRRSQQTGYVQLSLDYRRGSPLIPQNLAFSTFGQDQGTSGGAQVGVRAFIGFGNDHKEQEVDAYKPMIGLQGNLGFIEGWKYDLNASHSIAEGDYSEESFLTDKLTYASDVVSAPAGTDSSLVRNGLTCRINLTNPGERCIPFPPLDTQTIAGNLPADFSNYIFREIEGNTEYTETVFTAAVDGPLFALPAGELQAVLGVEHRRAEIDDSPDPNSVAGNLYSSSSSTPTAGKDNVTEVYTELEVPLLAKLPAANELTVNGSYRFTDYDSYGSDTTYKAGIVYSPVNWVSLRVTKGTSYRAPALFEQYQGPTSGFVAQANDPCNNYGVAANPVRQANCAAELPGNPTFNASSGIRVLSEGGAAAGLEAETSDNITYGLILQPSLGDFGELSIAVDYFDIEINNGVNQPGYDQILPRCYDDLEFRSGGGLCRLVTRDPATNQLTVSNAYTNIATQIAEGIDYHLRYEVGIGPGRLLFTTDLTRYLSQAEKRFDDLPLEENNGTLNRPKWSGTAEIDYKLDKWRFRYGVDWIGSMQSYDLLGIDHSTSVFDFDVGDYYTHHASVRYSSDNNWALTAGVRNLFDEEPPQISAGNGRYRRVGNTSLYSGYDYVGRVAFVNFLVTFGAR